MKNLQNANLWNQLKQIKLAEIRQVISQSCYKRSLWKAILWYGIDLLIFAVGISLVFSSQHIIVKLLGGMLSGVGTAVLFVWAHDAAHGTLFKGNKIAEILGTIVMLPSLNIYRLWSYGHNKVHHGFTSLSPIDWIWRPFTPAEYRALSKFQRILYRIERSWFTCAFHYLRRVWWNEMLRFNPGKDQKQKRYYRYGKLYVASYALLMGTLAYHFAGGVIGVVCALILPFIVFNYFIALIVYLHHTHPDIPFFDLKRDWSHSIGILYCSTVIHCSKFSKSLLHNIMIHIPHHLDIRIPFYNLPRAYQEIKKEYGEYFHEYRFSWQKVSRIFKRCKLYDFDNKRWLTFKEARIAHSDQ